MQRQNMEQVGQTPIKLITQQRLKDLVHYDRMSGKFISKVNRYKLKVGDNLGYKSKAKRGTIYLYAMMDGRKYGLHRLAWLYEYGYHPTGHISHKDHNGLNNCISNLDDVKQSENNRNLSISSKNSSGVTGVSWSKRVHLWRAYIGVDSKQRSLGYFIDIDDAIKARKDAELKYDYHSNHGFKLNVDLDAEAAYGSSWAETH